MCTEPQNSRGRSLASCVKAQLQHEAPAADGCRRWIWWAAQVKATGAHDAAPVDGRAARRGARFGARNGVKGGRNCWPGGRICIKNGDSNAPGQIRTADLRLRNRFKAHSDVSSEVSGCDPGRATATLPDPLAAPVDKSDAEFAVITSTWPHLNEALKSAVLVIVRLAHGAKLATEIQQNRKGTED